MVGDGLGSCCHTSLPMALFLFFSCFCSPLFRFSHNYITYFLLDALDVRSSEGLRQLPARLRHVGLGDGLTRLIARRLGPFDR